MLGRDLGCSRLCEKPRLVLGDSLTARGKGNNKQRKKRETRNQTQLAEKNARSCNARLSEQLPVRSTDQGAGNPLDIPEQLLGAVL